MVCVVCGEWCLLSVGVVLVVSCALGDVCCVCLFYLFVLGTLRVVSCL